jgi:hypothetical protein
MMGLDHLKTTYLHNGQNERPTVLAGQVIKEDSRVTGSPARSAATR